MEHRFELVRRGGKAGALLDLQRELARRYVIRARADHQEAVAPTARQPSRPRPASRSRRQWRDRMATVSGRAPRSRAASTAPTGQRRQVADGVAPALVLLLGRAPDRAIRAPGEPSPTVISAVRAPAARAARIASFVTSFRPRARSRPGLRWRAAGGRPRAPGTGPHLRPARSPSSASRAGGDRRARRARELPQPVSRIGSPAARASRTASSSAAKARRARADADQPFRDGRLGGDHLAHRVGRARAERGHLRRRPRLGRAGQRGDAVRRRHETRSVVPRRLPCDPGRSGAAQRPRAATVQRVGLRTMSATIMAIPTASTVRATRTAGSAKAARSSSVMTPRARASARAASKMRPRGTKIVGTVSKPRMTMSDRGPHPQRRQPEPRVALRPGGEQAGRQYERR